MSHAMSTATIRPPTPDDAAAWARFVAVERARTYADVMPPWFGELAAAEVPATASRLAEQFGDAALRFALAEVGGAIVGVAEAGTAPAQWEIDGGFPPPPAPVQLHLLYVHPDHHGTGLADRLLGAVLDPGPAYLWLIAGNARAERFYARRGFVALDERIPAGESWGGVPMHRMVRG